MTRQRIPPPAAHQHHITIVIIVIIFLIRTATDTIRHDMTCFFSRYLVFITVAIRNVRMPANSSNGLPLRIRRPSLWTVLSPVASWPLLWSAHQGIPVSCISHRGQVDEGLKREATDCQDDSTVAINLQPNLKDKSDEKTLCKSSCLN